jgi:hypothetical protein
VQGGSSDLGLHNRLSMAAEDELLTIQLVLQSAMPSSTVRDCRGVGISMAPFSSTSFYEGRMALLPVDPFAPFIWDNGALP